MILQIIHNKKGLPRQSEEYIGEVVSVRFYDDGLTFSKTNDKGSFIHELNYAIEEDIQEVYLLNNDGKTIKAIRNIS